MLVYNYALIVLLSIYKTTSMMLKGMNLVLGSFVIIAAVLQCTNGYVGEDTPVWTARCSHTQCDNKDNLVTFQRLEKGAVKRAITYMNSDKFHSLRTRRDTQSIENHEDYAEPDIKAHFARRDTEAELESLATDGTRSKRSIPQANVLVVAQYDASEVTDDASKEKFINDQILYVASYWRSWNDRVRSNTKTKNFSKVTAKIVGIIIALDRGVTPYLSSSKYAQDSLSQSNSYWSSPQADFPRNAYHAVATMTDIRPYDTHISFFESVVTRGGGGTGTIIVWDNKPFRAVAKYTSMVGFQQVVNTLNYWAVRHAEIPDYMKSGKAVTVLPGKLFTPEQQCQIGGYNSLQRVCPEYSENCELWCRNSGWLKSCGSIGTAFEGTPCVNGKVG